MLNRLVLGILEEASEVLVLMKKRRTNTGHCVTVVTSENATLWIELFYQSVYAFVKKEALARERKKYVNVSGIINGYITIILILYLL